MVKIKENEYILADGSIDMDAWLTHLKGKYQQGDIDLIRNAAILAQLAGMDAATESGESCLQQGLAIADILADLELDHHSLAAAIVFENLQYADLSIDDIREQLGDEVANIVAGVDRMAAINNLSSKSLYTRMQMENIRKMLIAMVDDMRVVLVKLAEHLQVLRTCNHMPEAFREQLAHETMNIYAPLANRLGIGQIKWEMEDLAFRHINPAKYKEIASGLKARRVEREAFVVEIVDYIENAINNLGIANGSVYGRAKHINSIYRKMTRKNVDIKQIYDAIAVRVLVNTIEECYQVLSIVHAHWEPIPEEFDDYITHPKPNGYSSLHTAVSAPDGKVFEVQIRTHQMHSEAERGVAAHWLYKEGGGETKKAGIDAKIEWLLEVLSWQKEVANQENITSDIDSGFFDDRVYIFTPSGDIVDLPKGSTPLDFAYHVHTQVGHRCRGAKIDGRIVQLTHQLKTGEQVDIMTGSEEKPSRDWLDPHQQYLKSSRAKAKVLHWFKQQDYHKNRETGHDILERECKRLHIHPIRYEEIAEDLSFRSGDDLLAALGRGDVRLAQVINRLQPQQKPDDMPLEFDRNPANSINHKNLGKGAINIQGVGNLLTHIAGCCHPIPGDDIIGYITIGRGISVHRSDCSNVLHADEGQKKRFIEVSWNEQIPLKTASDRHHNTAHHYPVALRLTVTNEPNIQREINNVVANEGARIVSLHTHHTHGNDDNAIAQLIIDCVLQLENIDTLNAVLNKLRALPNVVSAQRANH